MTTGPEILLIKQKGIRLRIKNNRGEKNDNECNHSNLPINNNTQKNLFTKHSFGGEKLRVKINSEMLSVSDFAKNTRQTVKKTIFRLKIKYCFFYNCF